VRRRTDETTQSSSGTRTTRPATTRTAEEGATIAKGEERKARPAEGSTQHPPSNKTPQPSRATIRPFPPSSRASANTLPLIYVVCAALLAVGASRGKTMRRKTSGDNRHSCAAWFSAMKLAVRSWLFPAFVGGLVAWRVLGASSPSAGRAFRSFFLLCYGCSFFCFCFSSSRAWWFALLFRCCFAWSRRPSLPAGCACSVLGVAR
jgi:hypothetical protein